MQGSLGSAFSCAARSPRVSVHQTGVDWWGSPRKSWLSWFPRWAGALYTLMWLHCFGSHTSASLHCSAQCHASCAAERPALDVPSRWPPQPSLPIYVKKEFQMGVMREQAGMATLSPHFVKDCLRVSPYLCMGLQSCPHNIDSGDLLLWSKKRYCGAPTGQAQYRRMPGFPRRRERLWDIQVVKVAHCSSVCSTNCELNMLHRKPRPTLLSKPRNTRVLTVKLL